MSSTKRVKSVTDRRVGILFYLLTGYILLQFAWWAYLLIDLNQQLYASEGASLLRMKILMVAGEGSVFIIFLLAGIFIMQRTIRREISLVRQQRNFLLSVTHELKTPLAAIKLSLQTLARHGNLSSEQQSPIRQVALTNTERLHNLLDQVLLATRIESNTPFLKRELTDLSSFVPRAVDRISASLAGRDRIKLEVEDDCSALADPNALESVLANLIDNAMKYGNTSEVRVKLRKVGKEVVIEIADFGPGIPAKEKHKIFSKFYRVGNEETRSLPGTGLGLYIVKELVHLLGGSLSLQDNTPHGSVFAVSLPLATTGAV